MSNTEQIFDCIIIGAGASGLMTAMHLTDNGKRVLILEARDRIGGRIHTVTDVFPEAVELGAEFIHGEAPLTKSLLKDAGISLQPIHGALWRIEKGEVAVSDEFIEHAEEFEKRLQELQDDCPLGEFLDTKFQGQQYDSLRNGVRRFAEGFDAADAERISTFSFRDEWLSDEQDNQQRVAGGYIQLLRWMLSRILKAGGHLELNTTARRINHNKKSIEVITDSNVFKCKRLILTVPPPVLLNPDGAGYVRFNPPLERINDQLKQIGNGAVIKYMLWFDQPFWNEHDLRRRQNKLLDKPGFIISDESVPTWWTQNPVHSNLLTGWAGGTVAWRLKHKTYDELLDEAMLALMSIFKLNILDLKKKLVMHRIMNWANDPYAGGAYSYPFVGTSTVRRSLSNSFNEKIWLSGEAYYEGAGSSTVEAALMHGRQVAEKVDLSLNNEMIE